MGRHMCGGKPRMRCQTMIGCRRRRASTAASTARPPCAIRMSTGSSARWRRNARAPSHSAEPFVGTTRQRREIHVLAAVESEAEREHPIGVAQRVEPARELDRDQLRTAALASSDEVQDPQRAHRGTRPSPVYAGNGPGGGSEPARRIVRIQGSMAVTQPYREPTVYESTATGLPQLRPYLVDLWGRRRFIWHLARTDLKGEHYDSAIGQVWVILDPLLMAAVYFLLRTVVRPAGTGAGRNLDHRPPRVGDLLLHLRAERVARRGPLACWAAAT